MNESRTTVFWVLQFAWAVAIAVAGTLTVRPIRGFDPVLETFFLVWFVGFLVGVEVLAPHQVTATSKSRVRWVVLLGVLVVGAIVYRHVTTILP